MKKSAILLLMAVLAFMSYSAGKDTATQNKQTQTKQTQTKQTSFQQKPVLINVKKPSSGGHNKNFPAQVKQNPSQQQSKQAPEYGKLQLNNNKPSQQQVRNNRQTQPANKTEVNIATVAHHHPYEPNYVRQKLQKLGVSSEPGYIVNREEIIHTDREHSAISYPKTGFDNRPLNATMFSSRNFNDKIVRSQMSLVSGADWQGRINVFNQSENRANFYYWHNDNNFSYCHYIDNQGYHWYGWYVGDKYFWTRNFDNRWWWYDADFDRWCFWNNGFWWWQDPNHIGDLYCYNGANYIPCNSAEDNVAVVVPDTGDTHNYTSPDGSRIVKVVAETQDAFLYDAANPPSFNPVYLASGVTDVMFSNPETVSRSK